MPADIEFNVRNGMTVGSSKHSVLDVNGALSGSDITCTTGQFLSGDTDLLTVLDNIGYLKTEDSTNWENTYTNVQQTSSQWDTAYNWGNHATQNYATTSYVGTAITNLVSSAPTTLDTLNELAAALGDDANFSTTVANSIGNVTTTVSSNSADWETAHGWGDHATQNYATTTGDTFTGAVNFNGKIANTGGAKLEIQNATNGGADHGIYWWQSNDTNWMSYFASVQSNNNPAGGAPPSGIDGRTGWALRNRVMDGGTVSFIWENHSNECVFQITSNTGDLYSRGSVYPSNQTTDYVDSTRIQDWQSTYTTVSANSADWSTPGTTTLSGATDTNISNPAKGDILVYTNGGTQKWTNKTDRAGLEEMYNYANSNFYNELTYSSTDSTVLTGVDVYVTPAKATYLFSREFIYSTTGALSGIVTTDKQNNNTLTKNMYYHTTTGALTSVTRSYS